MVTISALILLAVGLTLTSEGLQFLIGISRLRGVKVYIWISVSARDLIKARIS